MINLLSTSLQGAHRKRRFTRLIAIAGLAVASVLAIGIILLLPSFIVLRFMLDDLRYARAIEEQSPVNRALEDRTAELRRIELAARAALSLASTAPLMEEVMEDIIARAPAGIRVDEMHYARDTFEIKGVYERRADFLTLLHNLEQSAIITHIASPLSNLLQERDASFHLILSL